MLAGPGAYCVGISDTYISPLVPRGDEFLCASTESTSLAASYSVADGPCSRQSLPLAPISRPHTFGTTVRMPKSIAKVSVERPGSSHLVWSAVISCTPLRPTRADRRDEFCCPLPLRVFSSPVSRPRSVPEIEHHSGMDGRRREQMLHIPTTPSIRSLAPDLPPCSPSRRTLALSSSLWLLSVVLQRCRRCPNPRIFLEPRPATLRRNGKQWIGEYGSDALRFWCWKGTGNLVFRKNDVKKIFVVEPRPFLILQVSIGRKKKHSV